MIDVRQITTLHRATVEVWHHQPIANNFDGLLRVICQQHSFNFLLWHEEDIARSPDATDAKIAAVKRAIDKYNQQRNDWIERIDDQLKREIDDRGVVCPTSAKHNTETPGAAIDRLSILALRIYHMQEQADRGDASAEHRATALHKLSVIGVQHEDLSAALGELLADLFAGRKRLKLYRQFKMYNDPAMNPYLYQSQLRKAG